MKSALVNNHKSVSVIIHMGVTGDFFAHLGAAVSINPERSAVVNPKIISLACQ